MEYINKILQGDCLEVMKGMPDNCIDTIITDPPYGLGFMGKQWDTFDKNQFGKAGEEGQNDLKVKKNFNILPRYKTDGLYDFTKNWAKECLRVLKPGGTALIFAGSRTQHKIACGVEDAGFILKDCIIWLYGSGFPKASDISKVLDKDECRKQLIKRLGRKPTKEEFEKAWGEFRKVIGIKETSSYPDSDGVAIYKNRNKSKGTQVATGGMPNITAPATPEAILWNGWKSHGLKPAYEPILVAMKPNEGSYANNALKYGVAGLNIDGGRIGTTEEDCKKTNRLNVKDKKYNTGIFNSGVGSDITQGRFPANLIHDGSPEVLAGFPNTKSGDINKNYKQDSRFDIGETNHGGNLDDSNCYGDNGSAARFFKNIKVDKQCSLCYNTYSKTINKESILWKNLYVNNAEKNFGDINQIKKSIVQLSAMPRASEKLVQNVKSAGNLCDLCAISIAHALVAVKILDLKTETLQVMLDYIINYKKCILIQNLVSFAELWENIDTIPTIQSLSLLFGSVNHAITNYIPEIKKSEITRFIYTPKASKAERNRGCEDMNIPEYRWNNGGICQQIKGQKGNCHPTVKPLSLMKYLCTITKTPTGGIVLDPFCGSGTTLMACKETGRDYIGIEMDKEYVEIAQKRIKAIPQTLF